MGMGGTNRHETSQHSAHTLHTEVDLEDRISSYSRLAVIPRGPAPIINTNGKRDRIHGDITSAFWSNFTLEGACIERIDELEMIWWHSHNYAVGGQPPGICRPFLAIRLLLY
jgi:hypothetical protein